MVTFRARSFLLFAVTAFAGSLPRGALAREGVTLAPGPDGGIGAFSLRGPFASAPSDDETGKKRPTLAVSASGFVDLKKALGVGGTGEAYAVASGALVADKAWEGFLLVGGDDGVEVRLGGKQLLLTTAARPPLEDAEVIPVTLVAGATPLTLVLHQRGGPWDLRLRLVEKDFSPARGVSYQLAGDVDADELARKLVAVSLDRRPTADGWAPVLHVRAANGVPRDVPLALLVTAARRGKPEGSLFRVAPGNPAPVAGEIAHDFAVMLPAFLGADAAELEQGAWSLDVGILGKKRSFESLSRPEVHGALARIRTAQLALTKPGAPARKPLEATTIAASLEYQASRLVSYASGDDRDGEAQADDAKRAQRFADAVIAGENPFHTLRGGIRIAQRSPQDGKPSPFALYVPPDTPLDGSVKLPLVVALHALNGKPMNMMRWIFGRDEDGKDGEWEDRHPGAFPPFPAIVIAPMAHFNTGFRDVAEVDIVQIIEWTKAMFPIDETRVSLSGPSMGGIGAGGIGLRHAGLFSASAPLCGYHTYFLRNDMRPEPKTSWEQAIAEHRSNAKWAENGLYLPMHIVHGTKDTPVENSGILIDRYQKLGYKMTHEHPDEGHHVWPLFYDNLVGLRWLVSHKRPKSPTKIVWKTDAHRYDGAAWLHVTKLEKTLVFGEVTATAKREGEGTHVEIKASGVRGLHLDRDGETMADVVTVQIEGSTLRFDKTEPVDLRRGAAWEKGAVDLTKQKRKGSEGPIRDVLHDPLVFVVGTKDPLMTGANRLVAAALARVRPGVIIDYPIVDDVDLDPAIAATRSLVLVGGPESNAWTAKADAGLPIHVRPGRVVVGEKTFGDPEAGAMFVHPSPFAKAETPRVIVIAAGASAAATLRIPALPELLPDWVVFDRGVLPAKGQQLVTPGKYVAAGMFDEAWALSAGPLDGRLAECLAEATCGRSGDAPSDRLARAVPPATLLAHTMDAIDYLTKQHRELEQELGAILEAKGEARGPLLASAGDRLMSHVFVEERELYPAIHRNRTEDILLESLEEHLSIKRVLADLLALPLDDARFDAKLHVLKEQAEHHHKEEEEKLFPKAKKLFSKEAREELGEKLEALQAELLEGEPRKLAPQQTDEAAALK